jgi:hypothetical protein
VRSLLPLAAALALFLLLFAAFRFTGLGALLALLASSLLYLGVASWQGRVLSRGALQGRPGAAGHEGGLAAGWVS